MNSNKYRSNVAAIILNAASEIWLGEREDKLGWGFPQGGIEKGETTEEALVRELSEELGLAAHDFEIVAKAPELLRYDFPAGVVRDWDYVGQEQQYFLVRLNPSAVIDFTTFPEEIEFLQYKFVKFDQLWTMDFGFKTEVYRAALKFFEKEFLK